MVVLQAISDGLPDFCARAIAAAIAFGSWPSINSAAQPADLKRFTWSTESAIDGGPSIEMPLSSYSTISLLGFQGPAIALASCDTPSIRSPSEASTEV